MYDCLFFLLLTGTFAAVLTCEWFLSIWCSSSDGDENFVENKALLNYSILSESGEDVKPKSLAVSEYHFLLLIGDKVKVWAIFRC